MRITNKMMTNNALYNINNNKNLLSNLEQQYSSGKKITKPSDDPIVAVRALKFRTNLTELNQYYEKNIPDALAWMDVTESALRTVNSIITSMNSYCNQGANDYPSAEDRNAIATNLEELKGQLYQEGNTNYAGRYVFSGYKTDTSLVFNKETTNLNYKITEPLQPTSIDRVSKIINEVDMTEFDRENLDNWDATVASKVETYRMKLSYSNVDADNIAITYTTKDGQTITLDGTERADAVPRLVTKSVTEAGAYEAEEGAINFIPETGELILSEKMYDTLRAAKNIKVDTEHPEKGAVIYTKENQPIEYEVNFNQKLIVNTQGADVFTTGIRRMVDEIINAINDVKAVEDSMAEVDKMLEDSSLTAAQRTKLEEIKEQLKSEFALKTTVMTEAFQRGLTATEHEQELLNVAVADLGGRYNRLQLTESRLSDQQAEFEDLLSDNEDTDLVETIIKYSAAETVYNSSLSAASKLVQTSLLDFL